MDKSKLSADIELLKEVINRELSKFEQKYKLKNQSLEIYSEIHKQRFENGDVCYFRDLQIEPFDKFISVLSK